MATIQDDEFGDLSTGGIWTWDPGVNNTGTHSEVADFGGSHKIRTGGNEGSDYTDMPRLYQSSITGDFDVYAKVYADGDANFDTSGIIAAEGWNLNDEFVISGRRYWNGSCFKHRAEGKMLAGYYGWLSSADTVPSCDSIYYCRLKREGSDFTAYFSTNGVDWTVSTPWAGALFQTSGPVYVGIFNFSQDQGPAYDAYFHFFRTYEPPKDHYLSKVRIGKARIG